MTSETRNAMLQRQLHDLGVRSGDTLLVHTSMRGLGWIDGGPAVVLDILLRSVGEEGTLLFPTLTGSAQDGPEHPPTIDLASTPAASWVGVVPEVVRQHPLAVRSVHPTHSVAVIGAWAEEFTSGHEFGMSPCDESSPYVRLMETGGKIMLLGGVTHESNTSLRCLEELAGVPYHLTDAASDGIVARPDGSTVNVRNRWHLWWDTWADGLVRDFTVVDGPLEEAGVQQRGPVGESESRLVDAGNFRDVVLPVIRADAMYLMRPAR